MTPAPIDPTKTSAYSSAYQREALRQILLRLNAKGGPSRVELDECRTLALIAIIKGEGLSDA
jgi:hypothetical protein